MLKKMVSEIQLNQSLRIYGGQIRGIIDKNSDEKIIRT